MRSESRKLLEDTLAAAESIGRFVEQASFADFQSNELIRSAVYWKFANLGEAITQIKKLEPLVLDRITESWRIIGFRNQIIHGYAVVADAVTWQIIQEKLPVLIAEVQDLLAQRP